MHTDNRIQTYWTETKDFIKKTWPKFTDVELGHINANYDKFLEYLKEFYGNFPLNEAIARDKMRLFFNKLDEASFNK